MHRGRSSLKGWLAGAAAALGLAIALYIGAGRTPPPAAIAPPSSAASLPERTTAPLASAPARAPLPESHYRPAGDFAAAMQAAIQSEEERNDDRELFAIGYRWIATAPEAALDFVLNLPDDHTSLLVALVDEWTRRDPVSAAQWITRLPDGTRRTRVLPSMVAAWAESAPADALRFATSLPFDEVRKSAIVSAASGWAQQDPPAVLAWSRQALQGAEQEQVNTQAVFAWSQHDAVAVAEWLRQMPAGPAWDSVTNVLAGALVDRYPALALSLAGNIADPKLRDERIENVARRWLASDRAAAEEALIRSDLPVEAVSRLLR